MTLTTGFGTQYDLGSTNKFDFYSGSQTTVWFGNILLDDINSIQFQRVQNKRPIYGYASQTFDAVAKGTIMISGSFVINFRQRGYLSAIVDSIKNLYGNTKDNGSWPEVRKLVGLHLKNGTFGPTTTADLQDIGSSPDFLELAKAYEETIWGGGIAGADEDDSTLENLAPDIQQSANIPDGFNILITYGNTAGTEARTLRDQLQSTAKTLIGVHLVGESQVIRVGGQPVMEQYDFIAKDTDKYIGTTR